VPILPSQSKAAFGVEEEAGLVIALKAPSRPHCHTAPQSTAGKTTVGDIVEPEIQRWHACGHKIEHGEQGGSSSGARGAQALLPPLIPCHPSRAPLRIFVMAAFEEDRLEVEDDDKLAT